MFYINLVEYNFVILNMKLFYIWNLLQNNLGEENMGNIDEISFTIHKRGQILGDRRRTTLGSEHTM